MTFEPITPEEKHAFNTVVSHPLQAYEWGEFRDKTGLKVIRRGVFDGTKLVSGFQLTLHPIPHSPWQIGYLPKGEMPDMAMLGELQKIGKEEKCIFIQLEPSVKTNDETKKQINQLPLTAAAHPLFTKYTFVLDLTQSEEDLLKHMHHKARYNIRVAQKHNTEIIEDDS